MSTFAVALIFGFLAGIVFMVMRLRYARLTPRHSRRTPPAFAPEDTSENPPHLHALFTRWQEPMRLTRQALMQAQEASDLATRLYAIDEAISSVHLAQSRAVTPLQKEASAALEDMVRVCWREAQGEWHLLQARAVLRRALCSPDALLQRAAIEEFARERDKARSNGASTAQLQTLDTEARSIASTLDLPLPQDGFQQYSA